MNDAERNADLASRLRELDPSQLLGAELHAAIMRLVPSFCLEAVALRVVNDMPFVLLRQRGMAEASYPGRWHCPGSYYRDGDLTFDVLARLTRSEALGDIVSCEHVHDLLWKEQRGDVLSRIHLVEVKNESRENRWFPVTDLPHPMIESHARIIIPVAVYHYCLKHGGNLTDWLITHGGFGS